MAGSWASWGNHAQCLRYRKACEPLTKARREKADRKRDALELEVAAAKPFACRVSQRRRQRALRRGRIAKDGDHE